VPTLDAELAAFLDSGLSVMASTRDARLRPETVRILALEARPGEDAVSARMLENLRDNGRIAVVASDPLDNRSVQLKGTMVSCQQATDLQRAAADAYRAKMARSLAQVGVPQGILFRAQFWPAHAVRFRVEAIFLQTPGPAAGRPFDTLSPEKRER